jgi:RNA methyltransferase, TrmH family
MSAHYLRSASAFGFEKVIVSLKTADVYNEKVIRASKGAIFDLDIDKKTTQRSTKCNLKEKIIKYCNC